MREALKRRKGGREGENSHSAATLFSMTTFKHSKNRIRLKREQQRNNDDNNNNNNEDNNDDNNDDIELDFVSTKNENQDIQNF